jgi:hypothetical protein
MTNRLDQLRYISKKSECYLSERVFCQHQFLLRQEIIKLVISSRHYQLEAALTG